MPGFAIKNRDVVTVSNELELCLRSVDAGSVIRTTSIPLTPEVNRRDVVELNISLKPDVATLNKALEWNVKELISHVRSLGGGVYAGSSVIEDVSSLEPRSYRTTVLSQACGRGLMEITSQQIIMGVNDERFGMLLREFFRRSNPLLLALSASSPYKYKDENSLQHYGHDSIRMGQYERMCRYYPVQMWRDEPRIDSIEKYYKELASVSAEVRRKFESGELDHNHNAIYGTPEGAKLVNFDRLEPHQVYWFTRPRPDHNNTSNGGESLFSIELRVLDIPTTIERMQVVNSFTLGLAYYMAQMGEIALPKELDGSFNNLKLASKHGLSTRINGSSAGELIMMLRKVAGEGLKMQGHEEETRGLSLIDEIVAKGNDGQLMRTNGFINPEQLRSYLVGRLENGETDARTYN
jgi:gamma-glutamyl:cysteine ligase YbdK (ATP-grasp superfamily)